MGSDYTIITSIGKDLDNLFLGIKEYPTKRIIILTDDGSEKLITKAKERIEKLRIPVKIMKFSSDEIVKEVFSTINKLRELHNMDNLIINAASGDNTINSLLICVAFVNGIKAFIVNDSKIMDLPVLNISYYKFMTSKKLDILKVLNDHGPCESLEILSKRVSMSLPLISYHINGNDKSEGLKNLGLITTDEYKGKINISLNWLGKLFVEGSIVSQFE